MSALYRSLILIILSSLFTTMSATHWYSWHYRLPYFQYSQNELMGSESIAPDMFPTVVELNTYVKNKIDRQELKNKPVIYEVNNDEYTRRRFSLEIYETNNAYYINVNYAPFRGRGLLKEELIQAVDYLALPNFEAFYCDTTLTNQKLANEIFFSKVEPIEDDSKRNSKEIVHIVYQLNALSIKYINGEFKAYWGDKELGVALSYPIAEPIEFKERIIVIDSDNFLVLENGKLIKHISDPYILWDRSDGESDSNLLSVELYQDWLNIMNEQNECAEYSYSYSKNRFYRLTDY